MIGADERVCQGRHYTEDSLLEFIKKRDPFMRIRMGARTDTGFVNRAASLGYFEGYVVPSVPKQKTQQGKGKKASPVNSKEKEKAPSQVK